MKRLLIAFIPTLFIISCGSRQAVTTEQKKNITKPIDVNKPISSNAFFYDKILKKADFQNVKINSKVEVETGNFVPTLNATTYIENGQKVWMNLSAVFVNVARGLANQSGVKAYETIHKTYIDSDFAYLNKLLNVNFINYNSLQNILTGKTFFPVNENEFTLTKNAQGFLLTSNKVQKFTNDGKTSSYNISLSYSPEFDLTQAILQDISTTDNLQINYSEWENYGGQHFPKNVKIIIKGQKTNTILIENTKFDFSKMETPFSIPSNYTKTEIK